MESKKFLTSYIVRSAMIAVIYFVLSMASMPIAFGAAQFRLAEGMNVLLFYCPQAVLGLTLGCFLTNLSSPFLFYDLILGTLATFVSCILGRMIKNKWLCAAPSVLINAVVVGYILFKVASLPFWAAFWGVFLGQTVSVYGVGSVIILVLEKNPALRRLIKGEEK